MSKLNKILLIVVVVLIIALAGVVYWQKFGLGIFERPYYAVYLDTGDIYFGRLNYFPRLSLTDVWFLRRNAQDSQNPLSLSKFRDAFWGPEDRMELNYKNIVWMAKLKNDSEVIKVMRNEQ